MAIIDESKITIQPLNPDWHHHALQAVDMLRLDLIHPVISGNKWYKLKYNIEAAIRTNKNTVITFGGAYSNHLIATAEACKEYGLQSIGFVRGYHAQKHKTKTLLNCAACGMHLRFLSRKEYDEKNTVAFLGKLQKDYPHAYLIPEGGNNELGIKGTEEITKCISSKYTDVALSVGTGTTFQGIANKHNRHVRLHGFVPMKNGHYLSKNIHTQHQNWQLIDDYHFGGFGKWNQELIGFMNEFYVCNKIPLDIIYTGKMMWGIKDLIFKNYFPPSTNLLCIHTGGLQGNGDVSGLCDML